MHLLKTSPAGIKGTELEELYTEAHYAAWSAEKRRRYEELIMNRHDYDVVLQHSYDMGVLNAAQKMLASGMSKEQVAEILQMTENELEALLAF